jgi:hypothetical protein
MDRRTIPSLALGLLAVACATGAFDKPAQDPTRHTEALPEGSARAVIQGVVKDRETGDPLQGALVVLQCECLAGSREAETNVNGLYKFGDLPSGEYTAQVLYGQADQSTVVPLKTGTRVRVDFRLNPRREFIRT